MRIIVISWRDSEEISSSSNISRCGNRGRGSSHPKEVILFDTTTLAYQLCRINFSQ
jgi:hypothetical protein